MNTPWPVHGGTDDGPPILHDYSTNAHPLGPPPAVLDAVLRADRLRYPDPHYTQLRERLGLWHGVGRDRVLPTSGGSEAIRRLSLAARLGGITRVCVPQPGFGDYAAAAQVLGLAVQPYVDMPQLVDLLEDAAGTHAGPALVWVCDPCNPTGTALSAQDWQDLTPALARNGATLVVDQAYEPMRLDGRSGLPDELADRAWRMVCPNKALGLTGVRGAYMLAPRDDSALRGLAAQLAASWVLSAEGQAMLLAWMLPAVQEQLRDSLPLLREWRDAQAALLRELGFDQRLGSVANFWLARPPGTDPAALLKRLRGQGIKLRDTASFGLPGWVRLSVQEPPGQQALRQAMKEWTP